MPCFKCKSTEPPVVTLCPKCSAAFTLQEIKPNSKDAECMIRRCVAELLLSDVSAEVILTALVVELVEGAHCINMPCAELVRVITETYSSLLLKAGDA